MRLFVDSSVLIYGLELRDSNSARILDLIHLEKLQGVVNDKVIQEVREYFRRRRGRQYAFLIEAIIRENYEIVPPDKIKPFVDRLRGGVKEKDLEHYATVKAEQLSDLVAYDRDFLKLAEYSTPRGFLKKIGMECQDTEY
ncbi:MAG: type II toxin-antitoxin system VapC family toxin [Candidatus Altiarchaeota archaeon]